MKLVCKKSDLISGINIVMKAVSSKTTMSILECILIDATEGEIKMTANDMELDVVRGLEMGGDDYITKPFSLMILRARVNSVLRRRKGDGGAEKGENRFCFDDLVLDFDQMSFTKGGKPVSLSRTEQNLLKILTVNSGQTLSKETLLMRVWETEFVDDHALPVTIKRLRDKLGTHRIKSIYGIGYTWKNNG